MKKNIIKKTNKTAFAAILGAATGTVATVFFMKKGADLACHEAFEEGFYKGFKGCLEGNEGAAKFYEELAAKYAPKTETEYEAEKPEKESESEPAETKETESEKK